MKRPLLATLLMLTLSACSTMYEGGAMHAAPAMERGGILTDAKGMSLYTFDKDAAGKSACNGPCAVNWPHLMAGASEMAHGDWSVVTRDDGSRQWAYKGKPLYTWIKDTKAGDMTGDGFKDVWHLARP